MSQSLFCYESININALMHENNKIEKNETLATER